MLAFIDDVESDMSVFHRVDDIRAMPARQFINRAIRLAAYQGIVRARAEAEQMATEPSEPHTALTGRGRDGQATRVVASNAATLATDPGLGGMFETRKVRTDGGQGVQAS